MNNKLKRISSNPVRNYNNLIKNDKEGIDLTIGEGHFDSPFNAKLKAYEALINNNTKYSRINGDENLRKLLIEKYYPKYNYEDEIIITNGSTQGFFSTLLSIINKNDEVIVISPHYPAYEHVVNLLGGKVVVIDTSINNFKIDITLLEKYVTEKTKVIIINEPCNPTGVTYNKLEKKALLDYFQNGDYFIIVDELYRFYADDEFVSFSELIFDYNKQLIDRFIFINGLSKSHLMTGYRIGYVISNNKINYELRKINYLSISCVSTIMQQAAIGALSEDDYCSFVRKYYLNNRQTLTDSLDVLRIRYVNSCSGYYVFIDVSPFNMTGDDFCKFFIENYNVALVPGKIFGKSYSNFIRVSCCKDIKDIIKFINLLTNFCEHY